MGVRVPKPCNLFQRFFYLDTPTDFQDRICQYTITSCFLSEEPRLFRYGFHQPKQSVNATTLMKRRFLSRVNWCSLEKFSPRAQAGDSDLKNEL